MLSRRGPLFTTERLVAMQPQARGKRAFRDSIEGAMRLIFTVCGFIAIAFVLLISVYLILSGLPAIKEVGLFDFLFGTRWDSTNKTDPAYGILPFILTSVWPRPNWRRRCAPRWTCWRASPRWCTAWWV